MKRIAVDIGGPFTDIVYINDDTVQMVTDKVRSTPLEIGQAVTDVATMTKNGKLFGQQCV